MRGACLAMGFGLLAGAAGCADGGASAAQVLARDAGFIDAAAPAVTDRGVDAGPVRDARVDVGSPETDAAVSADARPPGDAGPPCPVGAACNPIPIDTFPFNDARDLRAAPAADLDGYACAPDVDESGGEFLYRATLPQAGRLEAWLDDEPGDDVDADVHILRAPEAGTCLARGNFTAEAIVPPGPVFLAVDTWVDGEGRALAGPYRLTVDFTPMAVIGEGPCAVIPVDLRMYWSECAPGIDCFAEQDPDDGRTYRYLRTPATGPVALEAHLVTRAESFPAGWPASSRDGIENHYALSEAASGYQMDRGEPWAPAGEGGSRYGEGRTGAPIPVLDEAWYVNMYWRDTPAPGRRMIVSEPESGRAVVAAAGWETGPGSPTAIGGAAEEIHDYLGTSHRGIMTFGFALDDTLPLGPIDCSER